MSFVCPLVKIKPECPDKLAVFTPHPTVESLACRSLSRQFRNFNIIQERISPNPGHDKQGQIDLTWIKPKQPSQNQRHNSKAKGKRQKAKGKRQKAKGKRQKAKGKRQKAKGKRQKAKGKRQKAKGKRQKTKVKAKVKKKNKFTLF
ncbi:hypothetical protein G9A89_021572 [Geosiphon pyriformis]|nr:hypothetical protein G9A89_021572 [Geosiphon pyriformis]